MWVRGVGVASYSAVKIGRELDSAGVGGIASVKTLICASSPTVRNSAVSSNEN